VFGGVLESLSWCQPLLESLSWCQPLLESLSWFKPGGKLSVANGCVCYHPYCKDYGFQAGGRIGGESNVSQLEDGPQQGVRGSVCPV